MSKERMKEVDGYMREFLAMCNSHTLCNTCPFKLDGKTYLSDRSNANRCAMAWVLRNYTLTPKQET